MITGNVYDIMKFSTRDGPGIRTTVFLKGCPLSCWWCHNPESQSAKPQLMFRPNLCNQCLTCLSVCKEGAISASDGTVSTDLDKCTLCEACAEVCYTGAREIVGREMTVEQVMAQVVQDTAFYDESGGGVTLSGGEPLLQRDFSLALLQACKEKDIHTAMDTSGFAPWPVLDRIRPYVDLFLYDLKTMDDARHRAFTGVSNVLILQNLRALAERGHTIVVRVPILPGINDDGETIRQIGTFTAALPHVSSVSILPYHQAGVEKYRRLHLDYKLPDTRPPSDERMSEIAHSLQGFGLQVKIG
jgi:pyruvate formate lyase activating enzyme